MPSSSSFHPFQPSPPAPTPTPVPSPTTIPPIPPIPPTPPPQTHTPPPPSPSSSYPSNDDGINPKIGNIAILPQWHNCNISSNGIFTIYSHIGTIAAP